MDCRNHMVRLGMVICLAAAVLAGAAPTAARPGGNEAQISAGGTHIDINYLLDVGLQISVEVGRRLYFIQDILSWDPGSIIELDKDIGE